MLRRGALATAALLAAFHVWLLGNQWWTGQLAQVDVVLRWLAAGGLVAGLALLGRRGVPVFGRQAVAVWLLAALLHGPALANDLDGFATPALPEAVATIAAIVVGPVLGLALLLLGSLAGSRDVQWTARPVAADLRATGPLARSGAVAFLPRPPPLR